MLTRLFVLCWMQFAKQLMLLWIHFSVCQTVNDTFFCVQRDRDFRDRDRGRDENRRYDRGGVYLGVDACLCGGLCMYINVGVTNVAGIFVFLMLKICFKKPA